MAFILFSFLLYITTNRTSNNNNPNTTTTANISEDMKTSNRRIEDYIDIRTQASTQYMLHGQQQPYINICRAALPLNQVDD